jgi:hypothetical protein
LHFISGHDITTVNFANAKLTFSGLKAVDYFGDGSFYLVDTPGEGISCGNFQQYGTDTNLNSEQHLPGHLTALTDVTPNSFIVLGGDTFHHAGQAHPWPQFQMNFPCPAHLLEESKSAISMDFFLLYSTTYATRCSSNVLNMHWILLWRSNVYRPAGMPILHIERCWHGYAQQLAWRPVLHDEFQLV